MTRVPKRPNKTFPLNSPFGETTIRQRRLQRSVFKPKVKHEPEFGERAYVCGGQGCRRFTYLSDPASLDWLIGRSLKRKSKTVVRCPQHVNEYACMLVGVKWKRKEVRARIERAKARDARNLGMASPLDPFATTPINAPVKQWRNNRGPRR